MMPSSSRLSQLERFRSLLQGKYSVDFGQELADVIWNRAAPRPPPFSLTISQRNHKDPYTFKNRHGTRGITEAS
jgi:hypothetical protein